MLRVSGLDSFYYLPMLHDMRYKGPRLSEIIRNTYHRDPLNGDIYIYVSRDRRTIRLFQYKHHAYELHERTFSNEYRFKKVVLRDGIPTYKMDWKTVMVVLKSPVIKQISAENGGYPPTQNGDIRSLFWLFSLMALQN